MEVERGARERSAQIVEDEPCEQQPSESGCYPSGDRGKFSNSATSLPFSGRSGNLRQAFGAEKPAFMLRSALSAEESMAGWAAHRRLTPGVRKATLLRQRTAG
jgi:hypothetical protein